MYQKFQLLAIIFGQDKKVTILAYRSYSFHLNFKLSFIYVQTKLVK